jgi:hypothetical protein
MRWLLALTLFSGCARADRALVYSEEGLRAAELTWDEYYNDKAAACEAEFRPQTPEMEACFGATYDADGKVATAVQSAVLTLRAYWTARAAGQKPDWAAVVRHVVALVEGLPPEARTFFSRVKGLP